MHMPTDKNILLQQQQQQQQHEEYSTGHHQQEGNRDDTSRIERQEEIIMQPNNNDQLEKRSTKHITMRTSPASTPKRHGGSETMLPRYAKQFAILTIITAYLGKQASNESTATESSITIMGLYNYIVPGLVAVDQVEWMLVYFVLFCLALNKFVQTVLFKVKKLQRSLTDQALQSVKSVSTIRPTASIGRFLSGSSHNLKYSNGALHNGTGIPPISSQCQLVLSATDPFVSVEIMEDLALADIGQIFLYASKTNQKDFDRLAFMRECRSSTQKALQAMDLAMASSRGQDVMLSSLSRRQASKGDSADALAFCAVARIFAEWRNIRAVPPGKPAFAFGMGLARRDLVQNIGKMEKAVHEWLNFHEGVVMASSSSSSIHSSDFVRLRTSPTLRQLLQHELEVKMHTRLPRLAEQSAASGLLWIKRQLMYQSLAMENNAKVPVEFPTPKAAFSASYESVYGKYHGFLVRTVFQNTFEAAPPASEVLQHMNVPYAREENATVSTIRDEDSLTYKSSSFDSTDEEGDSWVQLPLEEWEEEIQSVQEPENSICSQRTSLDSPRDEDSNSENDRDDFDLGDKIVHFFSSIFGKCVAGNPNGRESRNALASVPSLSQTALGVEKDDHCTKRNDVPFYLSVVRPLENDWTALIHELNMNDPSRV